MWASSVSFWNDWSASAACDGSSILTPWPAIKSDNTGLTAIRLNFVCSCAHCCAAPETGLPWPSWCTATWWLPACFVLEMASLYSLAVLVIFVHVGGGGGELGRLDVVKF